MTEELEQLLKNLKLRRMLGVYDEQLHAAEKSQTSYSEFVAGLLRAQWHERQDSALEWRIRRANLPERWSLESFPWSRQPAGSSEAWQSLLTWTCPQDRAARQT
jgi:DNA replication protein DnaC